MSQREIPKPGEFYRHFKKKYYQIVAVALHTETREEMVIYQALYGEFKIYARPLDMFLSEVDKQKYPETAQKYRFEKVLSPLEQQETLETARSVAGNADETESAVQKEAMEKKPEAEVKMPVDEEFAMEPDVERFLDARTFQEKQDILMSMRNRVTKKQLHDMAVVMDVTIDDGTEEEMYESLLRCIRTLSRFEVNR